MKGAHPKKVEDKLLAGNPGGRELNLHAPVSKVCRPPAPHWIKPFTEAIKLWKKEGKILFEQGVMTEAYTQVLAVRCFLYSQLCQLAEDVRVEGRTIEYQKMDSLGNEFYEKKNNPKVKQLEVVLSDFLKAGNLLGLDPVYRNRVKSERQTIKDPMEEFLKKSKALRVAK